MCLFRVVFVPPSSSVVWYRRKEPHTSSPGGNLIFQHGPGLSLVDKLQGELGDDCLVLMVPSMYYIYFILKIPLAPPALKTPFRNMQDLATLASQLSCHGSKFWVNVSVSCRCPSFLSEGGTEAGLLSCLPKASHSC